MQQLFDNALIVVGDSGIWAVQINNNTPARYITYGWMNTPEVASTPDALTAEYLPETG